MLLSLSKLVESLDKHFPFSLRSSNSWTRSSILHFYSKIDSPLPSFPLQYILSANLQE